MEVLACNSVTPTNSCGGSVAEGEGVGMISRRGVLGSLASISAAAAGGCALPVAGPHDWDIASGQNDPKNLLYALVRLTPRTVDILAANNPQIGGEFPDRRGPETVRF